MAVEGARLDVQNATRASTLVGHVLGSYTVQRLLSMTANSWITY